jgi:hypothetical protein
MENLGQRAPRLGGKAVKKTFPLSIDPGRKNPRTLHHLGKGRFMVAGRTIMLPSRMK